MPRISTTSLLIAVAVIALGWGFAVTSVSSASSGNGIKHELTVVNYITCWSLDPTGYHPAILLKMENDSVEDLSGREIRFQGRFLNLRTTDVTVARKETRESFLPHQRVLVWLKAPSAFELPIDSEQWPKLECKVMCRVGDIGDIGTQTLVITDVDQEAMSDDDARQRLDKLREYSQIVPARQSDTTSGISQLRRSLLPVASSDRDPGSARQR